MPAPIERMIDAAAMTCTRCGRRKGDPACQCWEQCTCGWSAERGGFCFNPKTTRCPLKIRNGVYNRRTRQYEPRPAPVVVTDDDGETE